MLIDALVQLQLSSGSIFLRKLEYSEFAAVTLTKFRQYLQFPFCNTDLPTVNCLIRHHPTTRPPHPSIPLPLECTAPVSSPPASKSAPQQKNKKRWCRSMRVSCIAFWDGGFVSTVSSAVDRVSATAGKEGRGECQVRTEWRRADGSRVGESWREIRSYAEPDAGCIAAQRGTRGRGQI